ncbi:MAG TPA: T9SS type A sorting domain-containing protein [Bacteroidia bacterium]|nr:T9SS type A sorting domain-containing protein [Bacteroidia bacterium]
MLNFKIYRTESEIMMQSGKTTITKKLFAFIIMVFSVSLADAQCPCYCTNNGQPRYYAICYTGANGVDRCRHISKRDCLWGGRLANEPAGGELFTLDVSPNPVSVSTTVSFYVGQTENVSLKIFDVSGRLVTTLAHASFEEGDHEIIWNAAEVNSGIYFLRMETATYSENRKLIVAK